MRCSVSGGPFALHNRGAISTNSLSVTSQFSPGQTDFDLAPGDMVNSLNLYGISSTLPATVSLANLSLSSNNASIPTFSTATTSVVGNVTKSVTIDPGNTLNLGADMRLTGPFYLAGTVNANGHTLSAPSFYIGDSNGPVNFQNDGLITGGDWNESNGAHAQLGQPGDSLAGILLTGNSTLTLLDAAAQTTGMTVGGINIDTGSQLMLDVNGLASGWVLRTSDPSQIAGLQSLIDDGKIGFTYQNGGSYSLTSDGTYAYINVIPVPEPSTLLMSLAAAGLLAGVRRRRAHPRVGERA